MKRKHYDEFGENGSPDSTPPEMKGMAFSFQDISGLDRRGANNFNFVQSSDGLENIFRNIFRGPMGFQKSRYQTKERGTASPNSIEKSVSISLEESYFGCRKKFRLRDISLGRTIEKEIVVDIKPGWKTGTKIKFPATTEFPITVTFVLNIKPHPFLERVANDLHWKCTLTKTQLERGVTIRVPMIDGSTIEHKTRVGGDFIIDGSKKIFPGYGMPIKSNNNNSIRGDFVINFHIT